LLVPYTHSEPPDDPQDGSRSAVEAVQKTLVRAGMHLRCEPDGDAWRLSLSGVPPVDERVRLQCRPITLPGARLKRISEGVVGFDGMTLEALTALICFELSAGKGEATFEAEMTLKLPMDGLPEG